MFRPLLLLALVACKDDPPADDTVTDDTSATDDTSTTSTPYGPDNSWFHADAEDVPAELADADRVRIGQTFPNVVMFDQHGAEVWLHQFYGRTIVLDLGSAWCGPCHTWDPYMEALHQEQGADGAIVISLLIDDEDFAPARQETVDAWIALHGGEHLVAWVDPGSYDLIVNAVGAIPQVFMIDANMTLGSNNIRAIDNWLDQAIDRIRWTIGAVHGSAEVCDDGIDNDFDGFADCMAPECQSEAICAASEGSGSLGACGRNENNRSLVVDHWRVEVTAGLAQIEGDTTSADSAFDLLLYTAETTDIPDTVHHVGDDEMDCTFDPPNYACARGWLRQGTWDMYVGTGATADCTDTSRADYALRMAGATATLVAEDIAWPFPE